MSRTDTFGWGVALGMLSGVGFVYVVGSYGMLGGWFIPSAVCTEIQAQERTAGHDQYRAGRQFDDYIAEHPDVPLQINFPDVMMPDPLMWRWTDDVVRHGRTWRVWDFIKPGASNPVTSCSTSATETIFVYSSDMHGLVSIPYRMECDSSPPPMSTITYK